MCTDTDGDGIDDGDEDKNHNGIFEPDNDKPDLKETNPRWQDTDNDSLSDGLEIGGWNISVYFEATGEKKSGYPIVVNSDPWNTDTDSDSLTDGQEFENATHPDSADTDGDGMTDLWELTGPAPSDPCGIEGTPPNLSDLKVKTEEEWEWQSVGVGPLAVPVYVRTRNEIKVTVRATDNVGLDWIRFHIDGKGEETVYLAQYTNNSTATAFFDHSFWSKWVSGYDLNITVSDVNGIEGYMEFHIDSVLEAFVQWLIGAVTALAEFVMELASAAIEWIWGYIDKIVGSIMNPIIDASREYGKTIANSFYSVEWEEPGKPSEEGANIISNNIASPFFTSLLIITLIIFLIISIIKYFIPWMSWLLTAVIICIIIILVAIISQEFSDVGLDTFDLDLYSTDNPDELLENSITNELSKSNNQNRNTRYDFNPFDDIMLLAYSIVGIITTYFITKFHYTAIGEGTSHKIGVVLGVVFLFASILLLFLSGVFDEDKYKPWIIESTIFCTISMILSFISLMISALTIGYCIAKQDLEGAAIVVPTGLADYFIFKLSTRKLTSLYDKYDNWTKNGNITSKFPWEG